ncbi:hypothetical protein [Halocatena marina]|uniref:DUF8118 domain-containing protein n=1 Tax=Halocatena marina TaxID=2934937 RepID=A0ABD5YLJ9_9EURY|nr:hypothetical protein [Halocatena marina]
MNTNIEHTHQSRKRSERITGPHAGYDKYGRLDHYYWRCERCGLEVTTSKLARGCWRCATEDDA